MSITRTEAGFLDGVRSDAGWALVETFAETPRWHPDGVRQGAAIIAERLRGVGLAPVVHDPEIYLGIPVWAVLEAGGVSHHTKATAFSPATTALTAPMTYLPANTSIGRKHTRDPAEIFAGGLDLDAARKRVAGRIVLTEGLSNPGRAELLESWGAAAIVAINPGERAHWGTSASVWGPPGYGEMDRLPKIPSLAVTKTSGAALIALAGEAGEATITVEAISGWFRQPVVTVEIPGTENPDEFVLLHSHYDSWDVGVGDNATGNAVLLEVARLFAGKSERPRRSLRFAWWPGHSAGRYGGSGWYAQAFAREMRAGCVAHLNCDSPGCRDATDYGSIRGMREAEPLVVRAVADLFKQQCKLERPGRAGDYSFNNLGITGAMLTSSMIPPAERARRGWYAVGGNGGDPSWHTEFDTLEIADRKTMENDARLYALLAGRLANAATIPLDYRLTLGDLKERLADDCKRAAGMVDLRPLVAVADRLSAALDGIYARAGTEADDVNRRLLRLARTLVRLDTCERGPFDQDPAFVLPPLPALRLARDPVLATDPSARVGLQRAANAVYEDLETALERLEG